jgi:fumarate hydratase class II
LHNLLESTALLADGCMAFNDHCAVGIAPNMPRIEQNVANSLMLVTALNPHIGYEKSAQIALKAHREGTGLRDAALTLGFLSGSEFDDWVRPADMTGPLAK